MTLPELLRLDAQALRGATPGVVQDLIQAADALERLEAEGELQAKAYGLAIVDRDAAVARLAELETQEPAYYQVRKLKGPWSRDEITSHERFAAPEEGEVRKLYAAQVVWPQVIGWLQPVTDQCSQIFWRGEMYQLPPSQAGEPTEAQLIAGVKAMRLFVTKNSVKDFRDGFIAALNAKGATPT